MCGSNGEGIVIKTEIRQLKEAWSYELNDCSCRTWDGLWDDALAECFTKRLEQHPN